LKAILALEDGRVFHGKAFGATGQSTGEVVFNTSMTGYQEVLTDPSYAGQIVVMTYPLIGNYGVNSEDVQSRKPFVEGFVVREVSAIASNWRSEGTLEDYLRDNNIIGISDIDTRALVRHIRTRGALRGCIATGDVTDHEAIEMARKSPSMSGQDLASRVTCPSKFEWDTISPSEKSTEKKFHVVAYDFGVKYDILRQLADAGCKITVVPAHTTAEEVLSMNPDGIFLSNGPGDPEPLTDVVENLKKLIGKRPIFGICLGHQLLGLAFGGKTFKLKFGHRGGNQPVINQQTGKVEITAQNHGFAVDADSITDPDIEITHLNLNDNTNEGLRHKNLPVFSVQYHPEAAPGPHDATYLFKDFIAAMENSREHQLLVS